MSVDAASGTKAGQAPEAIADMLSLRRLSDPNTAQDAGEGAAKRSFSVSKTAAVLSLRDTQRKGAGWDPESWDWSLYCVRAANALSAQAVAQVHVHDADLRLVQVEFLHPGFELQRQGSVELGDPLSGALLPDEGLPIREVSPAQRAQKWRAMIGRALNALLAQDPIAVEFECQLGARRYERRAEVATGVDPYAMRVTAPTSGRSASSFVVRVWTDEAGIGSKLRSFFGGASPSEAIYERWAQRILSPPGKGDGESLDGPRSISPIRLGTPVRLGAVARMGSSREMGGVFLVREGVCILKLDAALRDAELGRGLSGWIEAPGLSLTADESALVRDDAFEALVAWLHDMQAHTHEGDAKGRVIWPERVESVSTVSGRVLHLQELDQWISVGRELLYVHTHRLEEVPRAMQARVLRVWPSELFALRDRFAASAWVPVRALGERPSMEPVDLKALTQGSFDAIELVTNAALGSAGGGGQAEAKAMRFSARAYLHRFSGASLGSILVLGYGRRLAHTRDHTRTVPGITIIVDLEPSARGDRPTANRLRQQPELLELLYTRCAELVEEAASQLLDLVIQTGRPWDNPFFKAQMGKLNGARLGLRYRESGQGLRLAWSSHPALSLEVARDDSGQSLDLEALLTRVAEVGFIVVRCGDRVFPRLESDDPRFAPLRLHRPANDLLMRILGEEVLLKLPFVPEGQPRVDSLEANSHLLTQASLAQDDLRRAGSDARARARAQGRLLVARAQQAETFTAQGKRMWRRFDPRALAATRAQSLRALLAERPAPSIAYPGAVSRDIDGPVVELSPAIAALMHAQVGLAPARPRSEIDGALSRKSSGSPRPSSRTGRRRKGPALPLLRGRVEHAYAIGSITVAADGTSPGISIWSRGLKVGQVRLPEPMGRASGRLWLTPAGRLARPRQIQAMAAEVAGKLLARAPYERALLPSEDPRHGALVALIDYLRLKLQDSSLAGEGPEAPQGQAFAQLRASLQRTVHEPPSFEKEVQESLTRWPLRKGRGRDLLVDLVRTALAQKAPMSRALLSWKIAELEDGRSKIELGGRNKWIKKSEDDAVAAFEAAALVLDTVFRDLEWLESLRGQADAGRDVHRRWALRSHFRLLARALDLNEESA